jgi:hypothetical protein
LDFTTFRNEYYYGYDWGEHYGLMDYKCQYDWVKIYDGPNPSAPAMEWDVGDYTLDALCGTLGMTVGGAVSSGNVMVVEFRCDDLEHFPGFRATISFII